MNRSQSALSYFGLTGAGVDPPGGGIGAQGTLRGAYWPKGNNTVQPGLQLGGTLGSPGQAGYTGSGSTVLFYAAGEQTAWFNRAWTFTLGHYDVGSIVNVSNFYPGTLSGANFMRSQNYNTNGDLRTDGQIVFTTFSAVAYHFAGDVSTSVNPTVVTNLVFDPTLDSLEYISTATMPVVVVQHSNGGADIPAGSTITGKTSSSFTLSQPAANNRSAADLSIIITAPSGNSTLGSFLSYIHIPFTGTLTQNSNVITNLSFDPTRVGFHPNCLLTETSNAGADIPAGGVRVAGYTDTTITMGDLTTGQATNALSNQSGVSFSINTRNGTVTCTGDLAQGSPIITNLSINPIAQQIPLGAYDRPQWDTGASAFSSDATVVSVTSSSITFSSNAKITASRKTLQVDCARMAVDLEAMMDGVTVSYIGYGYRTNLGIGAVQINAPVYYKTGLIIDGTGTYVGPIGSFAIDSQVTDAYRITLPSGATSVPDGTVLIFKANTANTGGATLSLHPDGSIARNIVKGVSAALATNDILAGMYCMVVYDAETPAFVLMNPRTL